MILASLLPACGNQGGDQEATYVSPHTKGFLKQFPFSATLQDCTALSPESYLDFRDAALLLARHAVRGIREIELVASDVVQCQGDATVMVIGLGESAGAIRIWNLRLDFSSGRVSFSQIN